MVDLGLQRSSHVVVCVAIVEGNVFAVRVKLNRLVKVDNGFE